MRDCDPVQIEARCVCQIGSNEEVKVGVNVDVLDPLQENPKHENYCHGIQSPVSIYNHIVGDKMSPITKLNQYEIAGVHVSDDAARRAKYQETHLKTCCCGRNTACFEGATFHQVSFSFYSSLLFIHVTFTYHHVSSTILHDRYTTYHHHKHRHHQLFVQFRAAAPPPTTTTHIHFD